MSEAKVEQKTYHMPPKEGFTIARLSHCRRCRTLVALLAEKVFGGRIVSGGDSKGAPGYLQIANTWLIVNPGAGGPTPDKPDGDPPRSARSRLYR